MIKRPTFLAFETAKRALTNAQLGLDTAGHNMSNIDTKGYTRQRVDQVSWSISGISKYQLNNSYFPGMGAQAIGINQLRDPFLDARYRKEASKYGELVIKETGMADLENIFDEVMSDALNDGLSKIVAALEDAQKQPDSKEYSMVVRTSMEQFTQMLNRYNGELNNMRVQQMDDLKVSVEDDVNVMLEKIAALNEQITNLEVYGNPANELRDARNLLLDELSGFIDIKVVEEKREITPDIAVNYMTVFINNTDIALVHRDQYGSLNYGTNSADPAKAEVTINGLKVEKNPSTNRYEVTNRILASDSNLQTGGLRGFLDIINGGGTYAVPEEYKGIAFAQSYLDQLSQAFAKAINDTNALNGGGDLIASSNGGPLDASNIAISNDWLGDPSFIILSDAVNNPGNPIEAMRFVDAITKQTVDPNFAKGLGLSNATLEEVIVGFQAVIGLEKSRATSTLETSSKVIGTLDDQRQSISGVSENEEAISMMTYSNYYNAAARYMTTLDEALDKIINGMGIVGR